jgi:hypothetical protein
MFEIVLRIIVVFSFEIHVCLRLFLTIHNLNIKLCIYLYPLFDVRSIHKFLMLVEGKLRILNDGNAVTKKGGVQESYSPYAISHGPWFSCFKSLIHIYRHLSSPAPNCFLAFAPIRFDPNCDGLSNTTLDTTHSSGHALHTNASEKMLGSH